MSIHTKDFRDLCTVHLLGSSGYGTSALPNVQGLWDALELGAKALQIFPNLANLHPDVSAIFFPSTFGSYSCVMYLSNLGMSRFARCQVCPKSTGGLCGHYRTPVPKILFAIAAFAPVAESSYSFGKGLLRGPC